MPAASAPGDAAAYLTPTAARQGGRNARPVAIPVLLSSYCSAERTRSGAAVAVLGAAAGAALWFALAQLALRESSVVLAVVGFVLAGGLLAAAVVLGLRVLRGGRELVAALRRWHAEAPEVPVLGLDTLTSGAGLARVACAVAGVVLGVAAVVVGLVSGESAVAVGTGVAGVALAGAGVVAGLGWIRVRNLLRGAAPQDDHQAFAPPPPADQGFTPAPYAVPQAQPVPQPQPVPQAQPQPWMPPPQHQEQPQPQPWLPPPAIAEPPGPQTHTQTWHSEPLVAPTGMAEPDLGDTRLVADTRTSGRGRGVVVVLEDGRRLEHGVTLVGRDPQRRPDDPDTATTLTVLSPTVSKTHATMVVTADTVTVTDRSSTNGTTVVDETGTRRRLEPWTPEPVAIGSVVSLGGYRLRVLHPDSL